MKEGKYHVVKDSEYGFLRIEPTPTAAEVEQYYLSEFYSGEYQQFNDSQLEVQQSQKEFFRLRWQFIRDQCRDMLGSVEKRSLLDIGCGYCQALLYFRECGFEVYGLEPSKEGADYGAAQGIPVLQAGIESMPADYGRRFDVVTLLNVLEHLREPARVLVEIRERYLGEGGVLVIDVPNEFNDFQTVANDLHALRQWWIHPPAHLNYFSPTSLRRLLSMCGYDVVHAEASFPLEMFLLWGEVYVGNGELGKVCHERRVAFELNLARAGKMEKLRKLYAALAQLELGRQVTMYAVPAKGGR